MYVHYLFSLSLSLTRRLQAKHGTLYKALRPLATGLIKKQIAKAFGDTIRTGLEFVDQQLVQVRDRMAEADGNDNVTRTDVLKNMFAKHHDEAESKVSSTKAKRESKFKFVPGRESMLLPEQGHENGWARKQFEKDDLAKEGEGWRSNAYVSSAQSCCR